jgi:hypothetical protein
MKRIILLSLLAIALFGTNLNAQTACENFKKSEQIRDGLPLGENKNFMIQIVLYWSKRCACESGAITGGTWDYTVEVGNRVYDNYINGKLTSYQGKYTGPPFPAPDRRMSVGDCKNDNNFNINIDASDCLNNKFDNSKDPQQFGNTFLLAKCECEKGVPTEQRAKELEATMKLNYDNAKKYYGSSFVLPQPLSYTACPIIQFGGVQSNTGITVNKNLYNSDLLSNQTQSIIHQLAANSSNPNLKQLSMDLEHLDFTQAQVDNYRRTFKLNATQVDIEFDQTMQNIGQGIALAKFISGSLRKKNEPQELTVDEKKALLFMQRERDQFVGLHNELKYSSNFNIYGSKVSWHKIQEIEKAYKEFELLTAKKRWFIISYFFSKNYYTFAELENKMSSINSMSDQQVLGKIDEWQSRANLNSSFDYSIFANNEIALKDKIEQLKLYKISLYRQENKNLEADKLITTLEMKSPYNLGQAILDAINKEDFNNLDFLIPQMKYYIENDKSHFSTANHFSDLGLPRITVFEGLVMHIFSSLKNGNFEKINYELEYLSNFISFVDQSVSNTQISHEKNTFKTLENILLSIQLDQIGINDFEKIFTVWKGFFFSPTHTFYLIRLKNDFYWIKTLLSLKPEKIILPKFPDVGMIFCGRVEAVIENNYFTTSTENNIVCMNFSHGTTFSKEEFENFQKYYDAVFQKRMEIYLSNLNSNVILDVYYMYGAQLEMPSIDGVSLNKKQKAWFDNYRIKIKEQNDLFIRHNEKAYVDKIELYEISNISQPLYIFEKAISIRESEKDNTIIIDYLNETSKEYQLQN